MTAGVGTSLAAVVFTDIVGSTARDRRLGPERANVLRRSHFDDASAIVARLGGRVVKSLGDGQLHVFASPSAAVDAAVQIQQQCARIGQGHPDPVELRIGISAGETGFDDDGDCHGLAVVEAARLCDAAEAGEILVSAIARQLCAASSQPFRATGARVLKGLGEAMEVARVEWRPLVAGSSSHLGRIDADPELRARAASMLDQIGGDRHMRRVRGRILELLDPRPGEAILDVGCGAGDDVAVLAELVGPTGRVVGVDVSEAMITEARQRASTRSAVNVEFINADAASLEFEDATFDAVRSDRVFQYILEPLPAIGELCRVTKPGGRIVLADTDWETAVFDAPDDVTARINRAWVDTRPNGRAGQQLYRLGREAGLVDLEVEGVVQVKTELDDLYRVGVLPALARAAVDVGAVSSEEASRWLASLEVANERGLFLRAFTTFVVAGRAP